ncbi:hypothetical protein AAIA72_11480 [Hahella sp. SMD15-11]|uniref:Uncharacterized protein n=1 Tax=Thermohahella caldifontis TaxID=3142973 RepID=A0AB39UT11_9GAMM
MPVSQPVPATRLYLRAMMGFHLWCWLFSVPLYLLGGEHEGPLVPIIFYPMSILSGFMGYPDSLVIFLCVTSAFAVALYVHHKRRRIYIAVMAGAALLGLIFLLGYLVGGDAPLPRIRPLKSTTGFVAFLYLLAAPPALLRHAKTLQAQATREKPQATDFHPYGTGPQGQRDRQAHLEIIAGRLQKEGLAADVGDVNDLIPDLASYARRTTSPLTHRLIRMLSASNTSPPE